MTIFTKRSSVAGITLKSTLGAVLLCFLPLHGSADLQRVASPLPPQQGLFDIYEQNRIDNTPNFITSDFLLLSYSLLRAKNHISFEQSVLMPLLNQWLDSLDQAIPNDKQAQSIANKELITLLRGLATGTEPSATKLAKKEWDLIQAASAIQRSPLLHRTIDYTSFKPAGHYATNTDAQRFFRTFRYASSVLFPVLASKATGVNSTNADMLFLQAQQIAVLTQDDSALNEAHTKLISLLEKRFGQADDLSWSMLSNGAEIKAEQSSTDRRQAIFSQVLKTKKQPTVIAEIVDITQLEKDRTIADVVSGWRLLPSFSTPVSSAFQQLIYPNTKDYNGPEQQTPFSSAVINAKKVKAFPRALEIVALLGDKASLEQLKVAADTSYVGYDAAFLEAKKSLANASGFAQQHLEIMKSVSDHNKRPESALAFWTLQRYVDQLYIKQSTSPTGKGLFLSPERKGAQLEPAIELTKILQALVQAELELNPSRSWEGFANILTSLNVLQWKQNLGVAFSTKDESFLNELDTTLLALTGIKDKPLLVSVHSNPSTRERLWEATGLARSVVIKSARGALLSHHEFKLPMDKPLDNIEWLQRLQKQASTR